MARLKMFSRRDKAAMKKLHDETMPAIVNLKPLNMTPQQEAEVRYPYPKGVIMSYEISELREAYIDGLKDAPQLSRSVLEEVRERCAESVLFQSSATTGLIKAIRAVNLDDLLPVGDGWIDVKDRLPKDEQVVIVWQLVLTDSDEVGTRRLAYIFEDRWYVGTKQILRVDKWQPLPKAPNS